MTAERRSHFIFVGTGFGLAAGLVALAEVPPLAGKPVEMRRGVQAGALIALVPAFLGYGALAFSLRRSDAVFQSAFYGGMLFRLAFVLAAALVLFRQRALDPAATLLAIVGSYVALSILEAFLLVRPSRSGARPPGPRR